MKKLFFFILFSSVFKVGNAQVLDSIPSYKFVKLNNNQTKALYTLDKDALKIINKHRTNKILYLGLFGFFSPILVAIDPISFIPYSLIGYAITSNYNRKSLYDKLSYYERIKFNKDTLKMVISVDTNSYKYKYANHIFDITFDEYKALGQEKRMALFSVNDTTQYLYDYLNSHKYNKNSSYIVSGLLFSLSTYLYYEGSMAYVQRGEENFYIPMALLLGIGTGVTALGIYVWPNKAYIRKMESKKIFYNNIQQYYLTHKLYPNVANYIKNRSEKYKPKPLFH